MAIYEVTYGGATLVAGPIGSTAIAAGTEIPLRIVVTPTAFTFSGRDNSDTTTPTDSTTRGGYFFLSKATERTIALSYKDVTVT